MNKKRKSQNKQNNNNIIYMTIQSRMDKENTTPTSARASSIGMGSNLSNKNPKERNKTQKNPMDPI
jgi:hypothetical protein